MNMLVSIDSRTGCMLLALEADTSHESIKQHVPQGSWEQIKFNLWFRVVLNKYQASDDCYFTVRKVPNDIRVFFLTLHPKSNSL